jgi:predicted nucleotidyltransferase
MPAPGKILELVERFDRNLQAYRQGSYNEAQVRVEFIDPFFKALGWDMDNEQDYGEAHKDVIHEDANKVGVGANVLYSPSSAIDGADMMTRARIELPKDELVRFCRTHRIQSLALFGSVLRDDFGTDSDVDVLVEFEPEAEIGFIALSRARRELARLLQRPVDLVPRDGLKPIIRDSVLATAEEVYAACGADA